MGSYAEPTYVGTTVVEREAELEVYKCFKCGFHIGLDSTYLEQVGNIILTCPGCQTEYMYMGG